MSREFTNDVMAFLLRDGPKIKRHLVGFASMADVTLFSKK